MLRYIFSVLLLLDGMLANAQLMQQVESKPLTSGLRIGVDLAKYVFQAIEPSITGFEASADYEFKENFYAVLEGGYEKAIPENENYTYQLSGYYGRIGFNYDLLKNTDDLDILFVGLRYGQSRYTHSADEVEITNYWGNGTFSIAQEKLTAHWAELVFGMKTELFFARNLFIGWTLRGKLFAGGNDFVALQPYTIPGFAREEKKATLGATWYISYNIPIHK